MLNNSILFLATSNPVESKQFYETQLELTFISEDDFALVFDVDGIELRIQKVESVNAPQYTTLGWSVEDIKSVVSTLTSNGVNFERYDMLEQDELCIWSSQSGAKVAWFKDPDGNNLSITEH
ncbi:VOC family protein [Leucothrix arctica]|uniref:Glyoxalase n=1 Tax=Leucothrix arctica TaxID=1481894 RepID=A0A317CM04_9GAMM|nr:VOC family protein [Leucothrix arctica]PWQ99558.1 glyoxalase [Leucothrix arctica]